MQLRGVLRWGISVRVLGAAAGGGAGTSAAASRYVHSFRLPLDRPPGPSLRLPFNFSFHSLSYFGSEFDRTLEAERAERRDAAVHHQVVAGDKRGCVACQPDGRI